MFNSHEITAKQNAINLQPQVVHDIKRPLFVTDMVDEDGRPYELYFRQGTLIGCSYEEVIEWCDYFGQELPTIKELMAIHASHSHLVAFDDSHKGMIWSCETTSDGYGKKCLSFIDGLKIGAYSIDFACLNAIGVTRKYKPQQA